MLFNSKADWVIDNQDMCYFLVSNLFIDYIKTNKKKKKK